MDRADVNALQRCLALYRKQSTRSASEVAQLELRHSWKRAAFYACQKLQAQALGLNAFELTPGELSPSSPLTVPGGSSRRKEMIEIVRQLDDLGLSQFEPDPLQAIAAELERRENSLDDARVDNKPTLDEAEAPSPDAA